jgi:outer membrane protein TolC
MKTFVAAGISCVLAASAYAQSPPPLSLHDAVERALASHPSVGAARARRDESRAALREARAPRFPSLRLAGSLTQYQKPMVVTPIHGFTPGQQPRFDETLIQGTATLAYTLFDGGARGARVRRAGAQAGAANADLTANEQAIAARAVAAYLDVLGKKELLDAQDAQLNALKSEMARVQQLHDVGRAADVEVLRVEAVLATGEADRVRAANALDVAERELERITSAQASTLRAEALRPVRLTDTAIGAREVLVTQALESSPIMAQAGLQTVSAQAQASATRGARWPELRLVGNYLDFGADEGEHVLEWNAGVQLTYALFTGGATSGNIARADAAYRAAEEQARAARHQVEQDVDRTLAAVRDASARVTSLQRAVDRFGEVARIEKLALDTGGGTQTDYLKAEADLLSAKANFIDAHHREVTARVELARVLGQLSMNWLQQNLEQE